MTELLDLREAVSSRLNDMEHCLKETTLQIGTSAYEKNINRIQDLKTRAITDIADIEACLEEGMGPPQDSNITRDDFIRDLKTSRP